MGLAEPRVYIHRNICLVSLSSKTTHVHREELPRMSITLVGMGEAAA